MTPFANDTQSMQLGELVIENGSRQVILYGDLTITRTAQGLADAKALRDLAEAMVKILTQELESSAPLHPKAKDAEQLDAQNQLSVQTQQLSGVDGLGGVEKGERKFCDNPFA